MHRLLGILALVVFFVSACGTSDPDSSGAERSVDVDDSSLSADVTLAPANTVAAAEAMDLVTVQATWQCDRQRFAFDSLDDLDNLLAETLAEAGVSDAAYEAFTSELSQDEALRLAVRAEFDLLCGN